MDSHNLIPDNILLCRRYEQTYKPEQIPLKELLTRSMEFARNSLKDNGYHEDISVFGRAEGASLANVRLQVSTMLKNQKREAFFAVKQAP